VWFEFGKFPNSNLPPSYFTFFLLSNSDGPNSSSLFNPAGPTSNEFRPINHPLNPLPLSLADRPGPRVGQPLILFLASLTSDPHQASRAAAARARDGTLSPSGRPAHRGTGARSRASRIRPGQEIPPLPRATHLCILACAKGERRCLGRPGGQSRGSLGFSPCRLRCQGSKAREEVETQTSKLPTPLGFSLSSSPERAP
jgi:hypothetical protein